ncbi:ribitol-5-phosphate xylosyltransferase 1-like [Panonychus citri]|uniref:ribitol-5-phosphate xylosyltransferase 1-like n=1 Tax=Panonychus citri TaxID=50023 RepID=UPI0023081E61|nr:ribitol-5-phosphate xylosyltransferase 1-like [Panonychus citri]XP_053204063.1 ribitol-5-phosphate xylosyltransferase 1-like [Panonychus citri]
MTPLKDYTIAVFVISVLILTYTAFIFLYKVPSSSDPLEERAHNLISLIKHNDSSNMIDYNYWGPVDDVYGSKLSNAIGENNNKPNGEKQKSSNNQFTVIEIWSKAAIGNYLWEHILKGKISKKSQFYQYGFKKLDQFKVKFRSGPSLTPQSLENFLTTDENILKESSTGTKNMIIVLNGRSKEKIDFAKQWLEKFNHLSSSRDVQPFNVGAILLGHEFCFNHWIKKYLASNGGPLKFLFTVYDWKDIDDNEIYQWPLGVATYRNFPNPDATKLNLRLENPYTCNFLGTVYPNSSRSELMEVLKSLDEGTCFIKGRSEWEPNETSETLDRYLQALRLSDLTLSPIGMNHECYRIYEAFAFGSLPVVEENLNHVKGHKSNCDPNSAYRLLKKHSAPVIYIANWTHELPTLIEKEMSLSLEHKTFRRKRLINWYNSFKSNIRSHFFHVIQSKFKINLNN